MMHDKIILVDDKYLLTGGRNIDERHFRPVGYKWPAAYDLEIFVVNTKSVASEPSVLKEVRRHIDSLYDYKGTTIIGEKENQEIIQMFLTTKNNYQVSNPQFYGKTILDFVEETVETNRITLLSNPIHGGVKEPVLGYHLFYLAMHAKEQVNIQTPYVTWDKRIINSFDKLTAQIPVSIQTNSAASTPNLFGFSNYYHNRQEYLDRGVELFEFQSTDSVHNKSFVLDNRLSIIGTFNLDARSLSINSEVMLAVDGQKFTHYFLNDVNKFKNQSLKVGKDNRYIGSQTVKAIPVSTFKKILLHIFFVILRPIQFLL